MSYKTQLTKAILLLKSGCVTLSLVALGACESEYPQRKGVTDKKLPLEGNTNPDTSRLPNEEEPIPDSNEPLPSEEPQPDPEPSLDNSDQSAPTLKPPQTTKSGSEGGVDGEKIDAEQVFVCQHTALVSMENGRTNCFVKKDSKFIISAASFVGTSFVEVTLAEKQNGCTMTQGRLYGAHVSKNASCEKTLGN